VQMTDLVADFLIEFPLKSKWLGRIVEVLLAKPLGTAHVGEIAFDLYGASSQERDQQITRRINDFCSNARDFARSNEYDLFERVSPGTYRLRSFPTRPHILELITIRFEDIEIDQEWRRFIAEEKRRHGVKWRDVSNHQRLFLFAEAMGHKQALKRRPRLPALKD